MATPIEIIPGLLVGDGRSCPLLADWPPNTSVVHAAKTCHQQGVGYSGNLASDHPQYLWKDDPADLYLNMIDPRDPAYLPVAMVEHALEWIARERAAGHSVFIHCNMGTSRAPMLAFLYMKRSGHFGDATYAEAARRFPALYPAWYPGPGVSGYIRDHWEDKP